MEVEDPFNIFSKVPPPYRPLIGRLPAFGAHLTANPFMMDDMGSKTRRSSAAAPKTAFAVAFFLEDTTHLPGFVGVSGRGPLFETPTGLHQLQGLASMDIFTPAVMMNTRSASTLEIGFEINRIIWDTRTDLDGLSPQTVLRRHIADTTTLGEWLSRQESLLDTYLPDASEVERARFVKLRLLASAAMPKVEKSEPVQLPKFPGGWVPQPPEPDRPDWAGLAAWVTTTPFYLDEAYLLWSLGLPADERESLAGVPTDLLVNMASARYKVDASSLHKPVGTAPPKTRTKPSWGAI